MRLLGLTTLVLVLPPLLLTPRPAHAASPSLVAAEKAYAALDFDQVMPLLEKAGEEPLTPSEEMRRRELTALMHAIYERPALARNGFLELLARDPSYQPPDGSPPKIRAAYLDALSARAAMGLQVKESPPLTSRWWFWAGVGAVVVGGLIMVIAASHEAPSHDFGPYNLP